MSGPGIDSTENLKTSGYDQRRTIETVVNL
jgi:hypothetical protein